MIRRLKGRVVSMLARASAVGARQAVTDISHRIDTFARLSAEQTEFTREIAASSRRHQVEVLGGQQDLRDRVDRLEQALARVGAYAFLGGTTGLATVDHGHRLFVDTRDRQLTPHLITNGRWEAWNATLFRQILRYGDVVVDAGSNVGYFVTLAADLVGPSGHVYAFEANPDVARLLTASVEINGYASRVTTWPTAVTDRQGRASFVAYSDRQGDGSLVEYGSNADPGCGVVSDVPTDTIDALLPSGSSVRLMHFDIEGAEPAALRGARRVIDESPRLVLLIEWGRHGSDVTELRRLLERGFALWLMRHAEPPRPIDLAHLPRAGLCDLVLHRGTLADLGYAVH